MKRSVLVVVLGLPGAVAAGMFGLLVSSFAGDASPSSLSLTCWMIWGCIGGACSGAILGVILGLLRGLRWVIPILGGTIGAVPGYLEASGMHLTASVVSLFGVNVLGRQTDLGGYTSATGVVLGFLGGLWWCLYLTKQDRKNRNAKAANESGRTAIAD